MGAIKEGGVCVERKDVERVFGKRESDCCGGVFFGLEVKERKKERCSWKRKEEVMKENEHNDAVALFLYIYISPFTFFFSLRVLVSENNSINSNCNRETKPGLRAHGTEDQKEAKVRILVQENNKKGGEQVQNNTRARA